MAEAIRWLMCWCWLLSMCCARWRGDHYQRGAFSPWLYVCITLGACSMALASGARADPDGRWIAGRTGVLPATTALLDQLITIVSSTTVLRTAVHVFRAEPASNHL
jgi:hypothetical protein